MVEIRRLLDSTTRLRDRLGLVGRIRVHPLFIALLVVAVGVGMWQQTVVLFLLVMLHEMGHAVVANRLGYEVEEISLLPFGGVAKLSYGAIGFIPAHETAIAVAGPVVNLGLAVLSWLLGAAGLWSDSFVHTVIQLNLWIAAFNLLPGLPLDGGRIRRAARSRAIGYDAATREAYRMSVLLSIVLLALGGVALWAGYPHIGLIILGLFLLVSAWQGRRDLRMDMIRFIDSKRLAKERFQPSVIRALAAPATSTIRDVVRQFAPDRYHMVYVLDEQGAVSAILEEEELLQAVFEGNWLDTLDLWIRRDS